jgi:hypothetical protein
MAAIPGGLDCTDVDWECDDYVHIRPSKHGVDTIRFKGVFTIRHENQTPRKLNRAERRARKLQR